MEVLHKLRATTAQVRLIHFDVERNKPKREIARTVLDVLNGRAVFAPSVRNIAVGLGVSVSYVQQAKRERAIDSSLLATWQHASEAEREAFLRAIQGSFWAAFAAPVPRPKSPGNGHAPTEARRPSRVIHVHAAE